MDTIGRILTRTMGVDGSAWWVKISGVSSLILKDPSSTLNWRLSISSSSKGFLPPLTEAKGTVCLPSSRERQKMEEKVHHIFLMVLVPKFVVLVEMEEEKGAKIISTEINGLKY